MRTLLARLVAAFLRSWRCECGSADWLTGEDRPCPVHPSAPLERDTVRWARTLAVLGALADDIEWVGDPVSVSCARRLRTCIDEIRTGVRL